MGKYKIAIEKQAQKHLDQHLKVGNAPTLRKLKTIFKELEDHPYTGTGKPEALKHDLSGFWSRRINHKDRLVYKVTEEVVTVFVISAMGHYE
jgi:toxin YoeB